MKKKIFLSHSCKDDELAKGAPDKSAGAPYERYQRLRFAQIVRDTVHDALSGDYELLLDREFLKSGDNWPIKLNTWLARCDAAVIFLTPEALEKSDWVLKETTILCWRQLLEPQVAVFPVWLFVDRQDLVVGKFGPTEIDRIQQTIMHKGAMTDDEARRVGQRVADQIKESLGAGAALKTADRKDDFKRWERELARHLEAGVGSAWEVLQEACEILQVEPVTGGDAGMPAESKSLARALANGLLLCDPGLRKAAVAAFSGYLNNKRDIRERLAPTWVPERGAVFMLDAPPADGLVIWIKPPDGFDCAPRDRGCGPVDLVTDYVRRAFCCRSGIEGYVIDLTVCGEVGPENEVWLLAQVTDRLSRNRVLYAVGDHKPPVFVVLDRWPGLTALQQVVRKFPTLRCVFVGRDDRDRDPSLHCIEAVPHFDTGVFAYGEDVRNQLRS